MTIRFGIISDPQYSDIDDIEDRQYRRSLEKLDLAIQKLNSEKLDFVVQLGDFIDRFYESFEAVFKVWNELKHPAYHVLGNHDFCVKAENKGRILDTFGLESGYYSFHFGGFRFIFLNGNGLSLNTFEEGSEMYEFSEKYWESLNCESEWWNGGIDKDQLEWFKNELKIANQENSKVLIFCHYPLTGNPRYLLWNNEEILDLINQNPGVKVWMNGHYHQGGYQQNKGIHHLTIKGMVQFEQPSFAIGELSENELKIHGFGEEESRILKF